MAQQRSVTLSDVATVAGVSLGTASKALNGEKRVSDETRARVMDTARRLGFRPNGLARSFARGESGTVAVLTQMADATWSSPVLVGAAAHLGAQGKAVLLLDSAFDRRSIQENADDLHARRVDGVIVIGVGPHHVLPSVSADFDVPVAYAYTATTSAADAIFTPDERQIGVLAGEHLVEIGRRRVAHIGADDRPALTRRDGLAAALEAAGLPVVATLQEGGTWYEPWGRVAAEQLIASGVKFDAIFCGNDHIARGAESALRSHGCRIPDDVALVGVDNWEGVVVRQGGRHLTSINPELMGVGAMAASRVEQRSVEAGVHLQPCHLVLGETTGF